MVTVLETLEQNGERLYDYVGDRYGREDCYECSGALLAGALADIGYDDENEGSASRIIVNGEVQFIESE